MVVCVDFDGVCVSQARPYADVTTPLELMPGAKEGLEALCRAGHFLVLWSGRASPALRIDPMLDPLVKAGKKPLPTSGVEVHVARYEQMLKFVDDELPGIFDAIDDGFAGKINADIYIDDRALRYGKGSLGLGWTEIANIHGQIIGEQLLRRYGRRASK